jgi:AcrR family transcriptional regulator
VTHLPTLETAARGSADHTRLRILAATREVYARNGSRGTTTREVAERAGVNEATLFRHFRTKQQLIAAMLDHFAGSSVGPELYESLRELPSIERQLRALGWAAVEAITRKEDLIKIGLAEEISNPEGSDCAFRAPLEARRALTEFMREKIENGELRGKPEVLARVFMSLFFSYVIGRRIWVEDRDPDTAIEQCVDIFLHGAGSK